MLVFWNSLDTSDKIGLISILVSASISLISIIIAVATLRQNNKITREANRAYIVFFIDKPKNSFIYNLVIKNFGNTGGQLIDITLNPPLSYEKSKLEIDFKPITECKNIFLAPNQSIQSCFDFRDYESNVFAVTIKYKTLNKVYIDSYTLDLKYSKSILTSGASNINTELKALNEISKNIEEVCCKLS